MCVLLSFFQRVLLIHTLSWDSSDDTAHDDHNDHDADDSSPLLGHHQASSTTSTPGLAQWLTRSGDSDMGGVGLRHRRGRTGHIIRRVLGVHDIVPALTTVNCG